MKGHPGMCPSLHAKQSFWSNKTHRKLCGVLTTYQGLFFLKNLEKKVYVLFGWHGKLKVYLADIGKLFFSVAASSS